MPNTTFDLIPGTGQILGMDIEKTIRRSLHTHTPELRNMETSFIQARTPIRTGALQSSVSGIAYSTGDDLVFLYDDSEEQLDAWGKIYAPYQEGPDLGVGTFTNSPHQMFEQVSTTDLPFIEEWAMQAADEALDQCTQGAGVPL